MCPLFGKPRRKIAKHRDLAIGISILRKDRIRHIRTDKRTFGKNWKCEKGILFEGKQPGPNTYITPSSYVVGCLWVHFTILLSATILNRRIPNFIKEGLLEKKVDETRHAAKSRGTENPCKYNLLHYLRRSTHFFRIHRHCRNKVSVKGNSPNKVVKDADCSVWN